VHNSTVAMNSAFTAGGGLCNGAGGNVEIKSSTIAGNSAGFVGGVSSTLDSTTTLRNSIIATNMVDYSMPDISGMPVSQGFNLIGAADGGTLTPAQFSDQIGFIGIEIDPKLGPLQNNGGWTKTMMPAPDSPVIDRGHSSGQGEDQRNFFRPIDIPGLANVSGGDGADIGAVEFVDLDVDANNLYDPWTDGLMILRYLFGLDYPALTADAIGQMAARPAVNIPYYLLLIRAALDVDDNGKVDALTDGVMVVRYLAGMRGAGLTNGAVGAGAKRSTSEIENYIQSMMR
jgi:hypothetical protein